MKVKFFAVILMCLTAVMSSVLLVGCNDKYANLSISVDKTEVVLKINDNNSTTPPVEGDDEPGDEVEDTPTVTLPESDIVRATLNGASAEMSRGMSFWFADSTIASAAVTQNNGDTNLVTITAKTAGVTTMRIISNEYGRVVSEDITVRVYRDAETMEFNQNAAPTLRAGSTLELNTSDLINFAIGGENEKIYPSEATFSLMSTADARWNSAYGAALPFGITLENNVLSASAEADCGIVQLVATLNNLSTPVYVMVYREIDADEAIMLLQDNVPVEGAIKSIINPIDAGANHLTLKPAIADEQNFSFSLTSQNPDLLLIGAPNSTGYYNAVVCNSGHSTVTVAANIVDPVTGIVYKSFTKTYDVEISRVVTKVYLSGDDVSPTENAVDMTIQDVYYNDAGARVRFSVFPKNEENTNTTNTDVVLVVSQINGVDGEYSTVEGFSDVVVRVNDVPYTWGKPIRDGSDVYVSLGAETSVMSGFRLEFRANTHDESLPVAKNYVQFNVRAAVTDIMASTNNMLLAVGTSSDFTLTYTTTLGQNQGSPEFRFNDANQDIYAIRPADSGEEYKYTVTALREGDITIVISAESGRTFPINLRVRQVLDEFGLSIPEKATNIVERENYLSDGSERVTQTGIKSFTIAVNTSIDLSYKVGPASISAASFSIDAVVSSDIDNNYIMFEPNFVGNKLTIYAINTTEMGAPIFFVVRYSYYALQGGVLSRVEDTRQIAITVYRPISYLYWSGTNQAQNTDVLIYNINNLGLVDRDKGSAMIKVNYDSSATYFANGGTIEWYVEDQEKIRLTQSGTDISTVVLSAFLADTDTASSYTVTVTARVVEYGKVHKLNCVVKIQNPIRVSSLEILNYYDDHNGIRLNDLGITDRTSFELATRVLPSNAFNTRLGYVIIDEYGIPVSPEDAIITLDPDNPNIIRVVPGKYGETWIRIYPLDALHDEAISLGSIIHRDVHVVVEDGNANPYSIYSPAEFVAIGSNEIAMSKNYILMNSIDLSNYSNFLPLGEGVPFTGSLTSCSDEEGNTARFMISGIPVCASPVSIDNNSYMGLFYKVQSTTPGGGISNIDFYFRNGVIDATNLNLNENVYLGLLAGAIEGDLTNVFVGYANYNTSYLNIVGLSSQNKRVYFGAVAGEFTGGDATGVYANISLELTDIDSATNLIIGGVFGRFAGLSLGQDDRLMSVVNIKTNASSINADKVNSVLAGETIYEGIGGIVGIAEKVTVYDADTDTTSTITGMIRSMQVSGSITARSSVNIGGLVGLNYIDLGTAKGDYSTLYKNLASVRIVGSANIGGLVGKNYGNINYAVAEVYDLLDETNVDKITWLQGVYNVGGLIGHNESVVQYSYAMSYVNRASVIAYGEAITDATKFYGDILAMGNVGGLIGYNKGSVVNSFTTVRLQQIDYTDSALNTLDKYIGGFIGTLDSNTSVIDYGFAIGSILTQDAITGRVGEFIGSCTANATNLIKQTYACVYITRANLPVYNFVGTAPAGANIAPSSFYVDEVSSSTDHGAKGQAYEKMRLDLMGSTGNTNIYRDANWGFSSFDATEKQEWVQYVDSLRDVNKNLPILYDKDGNMLYNQAITDISITARDYTNAGDNLPTYFGYKNGANETLGSVVLLDNVPLDSANRHTLSLMAIPGSVEGLLNITVSPEDLSLDKWTISASSSDYSVAEIVQPNQSLLGAYVIFKKCGTVTITLRSLLNVNVMASIEINVVGGFNEFSITDGANRDVTNEDYILYIKKGSEFGYSLYPSFEQRNNSEYITKKGLVYSTPITEYVDFIGYNYTNTQVFILDGEATILSGVKASADAINYSVAPYIVLQFGGQTYRYVFTDLYKSFKVKVYEGISSVDVYTGTEANMPSGSDVYISVTVVTDNLATAEIDPDFVLTKDGNAVPAGEISEYAELISVENKKIATTNRFTLICDEVEVTDRFVIGSIIQSIIDGETVNAYVLIDGTRYSTQAEIIGLREFLIRDCIVNTYKLSLKGEKRVITQNVVFGIAFTVRDTQSLDEYHVSDNITFIPANIVSVELSHYTYGASSMEAGEVAGKLLSPGTNGVLKIEISPYYALFDKVLINSQALDTDSGVMMQQLVYRNGAYRYLQSSIEYDNFGNMILRKVTGIDAMGNEYFDGRIFVSTLITAGTPEGSRYIVAVAPAKDGQISPVFETMEIPLTATFAPYATLTLDSEYTNNVVGRGTVANLRLNGILQNSTLDFNSSYFVDSSDSRLSHCAFDLRNVQTTFNTGDRQTVDMIIPYYVGLLAKPDNGLITIQITIRSRTNMGGELNPLIVTCTLSVVDYIVESAYVNGTQTGNLEISVNSYTPLYALFVRQIPKIGDFVNFVGYSADAMLASNEQAAFEAELASLSAKENEKVKLVNSLGGGDGGIWWFDNGTGYAQITTSHTYLDFLVIFDDTLDQDCYKIRGRDLKTDFLLRMSFESYYIYNASLGCYEFSLQSEINDDNRALLLGDYARMLRQDFYSNLTEQSDEDNPYAIDSAEAFRTEMREGGNYMLTADIELFNWQPIDTAIASLDGNGHVIYLRSFAKTVDTTTVNYGLFSTLSDGSVVKNLILDVSYNVYIDLQDIAEVNFGMLAGVNNGIIYNCDVLVSRSVVDWRNIYENSGTIISNNADEQFGRYEFNKMLNGDSEYSGYESLASTFILTSKTVGTKDVITNIGGLVGKNGATGTITNSRVGRVDTDTPLGTSDKTSAGGAVYARQGLNIFSSGNVGGLVGENSGVISNSYFANGYVINSRMETGSSNANVAKTGGLVAVQTSTGRIVGSYARGQLDDGVTRSSFGGVKAYGAVGGLVYSNSGMITNSYSNMNLSGSGMGGFVYQNMSTAIITYSYSLSRVNTEQLINGMFVGVDEEGNLLDNSNAVVQNCFYLTETGTIVDSKERAIGLTQDSWQEPTGAAFEGFAVSIEENGENTWYIDANKVYLGPQLTLADKVFVSSRTTFGEVEGYQRGTSINPLLITDITSWKNKVFHYKDSTHKSSYITGVDVGSSKNANYLFGDAYIMMLADIDFGGAIDEITSKTRFTGHLYGNGHVISGVNFTQSVTDLTVPNDFGLFNSLEDATITNLTIVLGQGLTSRASHVGALAGSIYSSLLENITITSSYTTGKVTGTNMVGALAGFVGGDSRIYNVTANLAISANSATIEGREYSYYNPNIPYSGNVSYAGAIIGVLDLVETADDNSANPRVRNLQVTSTVRPTTTRYSVIIDMSGEIVGGVVGLIGTDSEVYKAFFDISENSTGMAIRGRNFTGGLVGENRGLLLNSRLSLPDDEQMSLDSEILSTDDPTNYITYTSLFASETPSNAVGGLVGLSMGGSIQYSYNRVPVINYNAKVAGGIIGLAINAPKTFTTQSGTVDPVLGYLQKININNQNLLTTIPNGIEYSVVSGCLTATGEERLPLGAILREVYTTSAVEANLAIGGLVGAQINAPIYTYNNTLVVGANNYRTKDATFISNINGSGTVQYVGSATGYLGLRYGVTPTNSNVVGYIRDAESGVASQDMFVTKQIGSKQIDAIGNVAGAMVDNTRATSFLLAATDAENKPFENFDKNIWFLDNDKLAHRFPNLKIGYDSPVKDIHNVEEFFEEMVKTKSNSYYRLVNDIVITGDRWQQFATSTDQKSLGTEIATIKGRLEGAVSVLSGGVVTTRSAKIIFRDFNDTHMGYYYSLFGYTSNFKLSNIDFIYEFDYLTKNIQSTDLRDFALIALSANASTFSNVSLSLRKEVDDGTTYSLINDLAGGNSYLINMALFTASAHNSTFNNVSFDANMVVKNYISNVDSKFSLGALIGKSTGNTAIGGVSMGSVGIEYQSATNCELYIGGLVGTMSGTLNLAGSYNKTGNILGSISVSTEGNYPVYLGGVVGYPAGNVLLKNFTSNIDMTFDRVNANVNASVDYIGGIAGILNRSNIAGANVLGDISVNSNNSVLYLGGVAGSYTNTHTFGANYSGFTTTNSSSYGAIRVTGSYTSMYVGGIYGATTEEITMQNGLAAPMGSSQKVYEALYSGAEIDIDVESPYIYAGGLIGRANQGVLVADENNPELLNYTELTTPNNVLRLCGSGFEGDLMINNNQVVDGVTYMGGLLGVSNIMVQDAFDSGALSFRTLGTFPVYLGGIAGMAYNHIIGAVSYPVINVSRAGQELGNTFVDPIVADTLTTLEPKIVILVENAYYSSDLIGVYGKYGYDLTADELFSVDTAVAIKANMNEWYYREVPSIDEDTIAIIIPEALSGMVDYTSGSAIVPVFVTDYDQIFGLLMDNTHTHKTILLSNNIQVPNAYYNLNLTNTRRIFGNGNSFIMGSYSNNLVSGDFGLFQTINRNVLISNIGLKFDLIDLGTYDTSNIGVLAGRNYGTIFNVSIGGLPTVDTDYMGNTQNKTVADFSANVSNRYLSSVLDSQEIATLKVRTSHTGSNIGGMVGVNYGYITNGFSSIDLSISGSDATKVTVGGMIGYAEWSAINDIMTNGRLNITVDSVVGGLVGQAVETYLHSAISNVNMGVFVPHKAASLAGLALGDYVDGEYRGVMVNTDISATDFDYFADNTLYSVAFTTAEMRGEEATNYILAEENEFDTTKWTQDITQNYGYPVLNTITNISFYTGDGTREHPYEIAETSQLLTLSDAQSVYYCLTRDMVVSPQNYANTSRIVLEVAELNGLGHTIVVYGLGTNADDTDGEISYGLFNEISAETYVRNLGIAIVNNITCDTAVKINYGGLVVKNYGTIANCYAVTNDSRFSNNYGTISFTNSMPGSNIGGLVSQNFGDIKSCWTDVNISAKDGFIGGIIGSQGRDDIVAEDGTIIPVKQATIATCFASGDIILSNMTADSLTSAGGIVGRNKSILSTGYVVQDCYVYGNRFIISSPGFYIGTIIGYNESKNVLGQNVINTYRTYSYSAIPTEPSGVDNGIATGNYLNMGMIGNQAQLDKNAQGNPVVFDNTSSIVIYYYTNGANTYPHDGERYTESNDDVANLTTIGSYATNNGLRGTVTGQGIYQGWNGANSPWARNISGVGINVYAMYLRGVTPVDRQENLNSSLDANTIFGIR